MSLPQLQLDDRDFQSLVDEARTRIARTCPAWDEHNVSDPGITLIELFAWMTEMLVYRVNRIPTKAQIALLELVGVRLAPVEVARTELRLRLSEAPAERVEVAAGEIEVATAGHVRGEPVVFRTVEPFVVPPLALAAVKLVRRGVADDVPVEAGSARPTRLQRPGLTSPGQPDDGLYLGFRERLGSLVVAVQSEVEPAHGTGIAPQQPPWQWQASRADGTWSQASVLSDDTGGFNFSTGTVELQLPRRTGLATVGGRRLHWLRCLLPERADTNGAGYTNPPRILQLQASASGALVNAEHAARASAPGALSQAPDVEAEDAEVIGHSDGSPGQTFQLRRRPALELEESDGLDVLDPGADEWIAWEQRDSFAESGPTDVHFCFDPVAGEVSLGPAIRERDRWDQRGAIPPEGATLRMRYRWGGGASGNVEANTLTVMRRAVAGIASVTNPAPARGGVDAESLAEAMRRAPLELRTRSRAVTASDYSVLARAASRRVARARCVAPTAGQPEVVVGILPTVPNPAERIVPGDLLPSEELLVDVAKFLDERRLLGTQLRLAPITLRGVTVVVEIEAGPRADRQGLVQKVTAALNRYINPYVGGAVKGAGEGWEFGHALGVAEVEVVARAVPGVIDVSILRLYATDLTTGEVEPRPVDGRLEIGADELVASAEHLVRVLVPGAP